MKEDKVVRNTLTLDITNSSTDNQLIVGLMSYIDDALGLDYESMRRQLEFVGGYILKKQYEQQGTQIGALRDTL